MPTQVQFRRGTSSQNDAFTGANGEITVDLTNQTLRLHDGVNAGGTKLSNTNNAQFSGNTQFTGNVVINRSLTVGAPLYANNIIANGHIDVGNTADFYDLATFHGNMQVNGHIDVGNTADFYNLVTMHSNTTISGNTIVDASLTVTNTAIFNRNVRLNNDGGYYLHVGNSSVNTQIYPGNVYLNGSTLVIGNNAANTTVNSSTITIGTTVINSSSITLAGTPINSTSFSGTANNALSLGGIPAANYALLTGANFTGDVSVTGNLTVTGSVVSLNTNTLDVKDLNITVAKGAASPAAADGAGLTVDGANATFTYNSTTNTFNFSHYVKIGNSTVNSTINSTAFTGDSATVGGNTASTLRGYSDSVGATAYSNAVTYVDTKIGTANSAITGNAATAYSNATAYTDTKIGTANAAITGNAATAYSNATAYADTKAATAYSNATSYTDTKIATANLAITGNAATAYSNATSYTDTKIATANLAITGNAATAYSNATSYTDTKIATANLAITGNAATAYSNATAYADTKSATAYSNATSYADTKAATAYSNATSYTDTKIATANLAITGNAATSYSNAVSYVDGKIGTANAAITGNAATAYSNATAYADTKSATAYSNATAYADTKAATAYSNATSYADTKAATAYSNATSYADTKSSTAYSNAVSYVDTKIGTANAAITGNAATAYSNAVSYTDTKIATANLAITGNAATAYSNAVTYTDTKIATANLAITGNAATAYSNAVTYTDTKIATANLAITGNAATAYSNATAYTDTKIGTANAAITGNAATAYSNATAYTDTKIATANLAITGNAATAYSNAIAYAASNTYVNSTFAPLAGATFTGAVVISNNLTVSGNLTLSGNNIIVGANNLIVQDAVVSYHTPANLAPLTSNDGKLIGSAYHYYNGADSQALLAMNQTTRRLVYWANSTDASIADPTGTTLGTIQSLDHWFGNDTVYSTVNATTFTGTANNATNLNGQAAAYYTNATNITTGTLPWAQAPTGTANTSAQLTWSNTQTFSNTITFSQTIVGTVNNALNLGGTAAASYQLNSTLNANIASYLPNYTGVVNGSSHTVGTYGSVAGGLSANATVLAIGNSSVNATVNSTVFSGTANNATNLGGTAASGYQTTAGLSANVATLTSNNASYLGGTIAASYQLNSTLNANIASYLPTYTGVVNASSYTVATYGSVAGGLSANATVLAIGNSSVNATVNSSVFSGTALTANNATNLGGTAAASYQLNSTLNANIASYLPTYTGTVNAASYNVGTYGSATSGLVGNSTVLAIGNSSVNATVNSTVFSGTANNATNLGGTAAASYQLNSTLNANIAAYLPTYSGVVNASSHTVGTYGSATGGLSANATVLAIGNSSVFATVNATTFTGTALTANNATNLGGQAAAYYTNATNITTGTLPWAQAPSGTVNSSAAFTISGVYTHNADLIVNNQKNLKFQTINTSAYAYFTQQNDDNFVFYSTNTAYGARAIFSIYANSVTSDFRFSAPVTFNAYVNLGSQSVYANGGVGTAGQVLTSDGTKTYWSTVSAAGVNTAAQYTFSNTITFSNTVTFSVAINGTANNATNLNGQAASYYLNATNINSGTLAWAQAPTNTVNTSGAFTFTGVETFNANVILGAGLSANGGYGTSGQVLTSNGTATYWAAAAAGVNTAAQYTWSNTQTFSNTITFSSTIVGTVNNALYLGGTVASGYQTTAGLSANVATLTSNNSTYLNGQLASYYLNATNITTGTLPWAQAPTNTVNTSGSFTISGVYTHTANVSITGTTKMTGVVDTASANVLNQTLTDGATVSWDASLGQVATLTLGGNRTVANPTNLKVATYVLHVLQDATGSRTITWGTSYKWPGGAAPVLSTGAGKRDVFSFISDGTNLYGSYLNDVR